jgi:NADPH-dependent 7-cyano-7-deazaguanine reductase QueF
MKITYSFALKSNCPVDLLPDVYECQVVSDRPIAVEDILEVSEKYKEVFEFQEVLTEKLARQLAATVTTVGWHSGVKVVAEA